MQTMNVLYRIECKLRKCTQVQKAMDTFSGPLDDINRVRILGQDWILKVSSKAQPPSLAPQTGAASAQKPQVWKLTVCLRVQPCDTGDWWLNTHSVPWPLLGMKGTNMRAKSMSYLGLRRTNSSLSPACCPRAPQPCPKPPPLAGAVDWVWDWGSF